MDKQTMAAQMAQDAIYIHQAKQFVQTSIADKPFTARMVQRIIEIAERKVDVMNRELAVTLREHEVEEREHVFTHASKAMASSHDQNTTTQAARDHFKTFEQEVIARGKKLQAQMRSDGFVANANAVNNLVDLLQRKMLVLQALRDRPSTETNSSANTYPIVCTEGQRAILLLALEALSTYVSPGPRAQKNILAIRAMLLGRE